MNRLPSILTATGRGLPMVFLSMSPSFRSVLVHCQDVEAGVRRDMDRFRLGMHLEKRKWVAT